MPLLAVIGAVDDIAGIDQRVGQLPVEILVIFDDEYAHDRSGLLMGQL
nr:hypothetical protein [Mesorhizobium sp. L2C054A000]